MRLVRELCAGGGCEHFWLSGKTELQVGGAIPADPSAQGDTQFDAHEQGSSMGTNGWTQILGRQSGLDATLGGIVSGIAGR